MITISLIFRLTNEVTLPITMYSLRLLVVYRSSSMRELDAEILEKLDELRCESILTYLNYRGKLKDYLAGSITERELDRSFEAWIEADKAAEAFRNKHFVLENFRI